MVRLPINKRRYLVALVLTTMIFLLGLLVGYGITGVRLTRVQEHEKDLRLSYDSVQLQTLYISSLLRNQNCALLTKALDSNIHSIQKTADNLENYIKDSQLQREDYNSLKREYILEELRYWLLAQQFKDICNKDVVLVLYFFSSSPEKSCNDCGPQGTILSYLKNKFQEKLLVFSIDADFDQEPMIPTLLADYNVTRTPSVVVDTTLYPGLQTEEKLLKEICNKFKTKITECNEQQ